MSEKNVYQRLAEVRKSISYLKKEKSGNQFKYVGSSDVLGALHSAINDAGLLLIPSITNHKLNERVELIGSEDNQKERATYFTELEMNMRWQNIDDKNDFVDSAWYAQGVDIAGEKGVGKALTYGEKYFLLKFFNIATDKDDPDSFQRKQESIQPPKLIDGKQLAALNDEARKVAELAGAELSIIKNKFSETAKVPSLDHLPANLFSSAMAQLIKWKQSYEKNAQESKAAEQKQNDINWGNAQ